VLCVTAAPAVGVHLWLPTEYAAIVVSAPLAVLMVLGLRRACAIAVAVDDRGVVIRDFFYRHTFTWEEIASVELAPPNSRGFRKRIGFVLHDGSGVAPEATAVRPSKRDEFLQPCGSRQPITRSNSASSEGRSRARHETSTTAAHPVRRSERS
jgi:hypothetical protein